MLKRACFACTTLLHTIGNLGLSQSGAPPIKSWIHPCEIQMVNLLFDISQLYQVVYSSLMYFFLTNSSHSLCSDKGMQRQIQDLVKGGPKIIWPIFADPAQWSHVNEVSPYWPGSRACLRAPEALGFFITKYAFSPFWGTFLYYF